MSSDPGDSFSTELWWRKVGGAAWAVFYSLFASWLALPLLSLAQNPFDIMSALLLTLRLSGWWWMHLVILSALVSVWTFIQAGHTSIYPTVSRSIMSNLKQGLQPALLTSFLQFIGCGAVSAWCLLKLVELPYSSAWSPCKEGSGQILCPNHSHLFLLLAGAYAGLASAVEFHFQNGNYLSIPIINMDRYSLVKMKLAAKAWTIVKSSLVTLKQFYLLYTAAALVLGGLSKPAGLPLSSLLSPSLAATALLILLFIHFVSTTISVCLSVHLTVPLPQMELDAALQAAKSDQPLVSLLALQALGGQVADRKDIRRSVFELSLPGGHPHTWNTLLQVCNEKMGSVSKELDTILSPPPPKVDEPAAVAPMVSQVQEITSPGMRRLAPKDSSYKDRAVTEANPPAVQRLYTASTGFFEGLKKRPLIGWLFNQPPDLNLRTVFTRSQSVIYSVEILSFVVAASVKEDNYGVLQKDLPDILAGLLNLEQDIDRCRGQGATYYRRKSVDLPDVHLKNELKCAVKSAIYRIVLGFKEHILAVPLPGDLRQRVRNYHNFLEA